MAERMSYVRGSNSSWIIFCGKRFPDDTVDYFEMKKEIVTHGEKL